jgi:transposase
MTRSTINKAAKTYAGLDVSLKETAICVVDDAGKIVFERMVATDPQVIAKYLAKHAPGLERFGLESGSTSAWLWREFRELGLPVICLDSRHAHRVLSMKRNKNDRNDARGLADLVRMGWYREARVRSIDAQFVRSMLLSRQQLLQSRRAIENQIRGALKTLGVMTGTTKGRGFMPRVIELRADNDWLGPVLDPLIAAHASIAEQLKVVSASVLDAAREDADVRRMMTVPGIGAMTALAFKAAIDDPRRFTSSTKVGPYLGLTPRQYQSGESEWIGGIGKTNDPLLRSYLYEAAGVLMTRVRRSCPLKIWALRLAKRIGWKRASIAVARKLAVILHAIWRNGTEFEWHTADMVLA